MDSPLRRRILCIRPRLNDQAGTILTVTSNEWVEALSLHADVVSIENDFDFDAICQIAKPDLVVLDAVNWTRPVPLQITSPRSHPAIPRILFLNSDPHDPMRTLTLRMAEELGIDAVFITSETYRQHLPELQHAPCFFVPQFIDDSIYRDYGLEKTIPVSVFGGHLLPEFYSWRARLLAEIPSVFPTLIYSHPGYLKGRSKPFAVEGEAYARLLNRSYFSAADTTRLDYGVRKHLEIPASGAVLLAPHSDALKSYGFVDLEHCLFGSGPELFAKIDRLARHPSEYERVRDAGATLVRNRYTRRNWRLMLDWLECRLALKAGQVVQQVGRYGPFHGMDPTRSSSSVMAVPQADSDMAARLRTARHAVLTGHGLMEAEVSLGEASQWLPHAAEPSFLMAILVLLKGDPLAAGIAIERRAALQATLDGALGRLDPVEIAWLLLIARLIDHADLETAMRNQATTLRHLSLRRMFWLFDDNCTGEATSKSGLLTRRRDDHLSVHWLGEEDFTQWCDLLRRVLMANLASSGARSVSLRLQAAA